MSNNDCLDRYDASTAIALVMSNVNRTGHAHFVATETLKAADASSATNQAILPANVVRETAKGCLPGAADTPTSNRPSQSLHSSSSRSPIEGYHYVRADRRGGGRDNAGFGLVRFLSATRCATSRQGYLANSTTTTVMTRNSIRRTPANCGTHSGPSQTW